MSGLHRIHRIRPNPAQSRVLFCFRVDTLRQLALAATMQVSGKPRRGSASQLNPNGCRDAVTPNRTGLARLRDRGWVCCRVVDEGALSRLYARYGYAVFRRCAVYLLVADAQPLVHEVFVAAVRSGGAPPAGIDPRTWLCRIADRLCSEHLRAQPRTPSASTEASGFLPAGTSAEAVSDEAALAREISDDDRDALLAVRRLLPRLEPALRRLAVLYYLDELSEEELARELEWSRRTLDKRLAQLLTLAGPLFRERAAS